YGIVGGRKRYSCKYPGCNNGYYTQTSEGFVNKHFFRFRKNPPYHQLWKDACNITDTNVKNFCICEDHFKESDFVNERKERLNINAVPLPINPSKEDSLLSDKQVTADECLRDPSGSSVQRYCLLNSTVFHSQKEKYGIDAGRKKYSCKYPGCNNWYYSKLPEGFVNKHFFRFPKNPFYHQLWKDICNITDTNATNFNICEDHFKDSDFVNEKKERLNIKVVPLLINPPKEDPLLLDNEVTVECLTDPSGSSLQRNCFSNSTYFDSQNKKVTYYSQDHDYCLRLNNLIVVGRKKYSCKYPGCNNWYYTKLPEGFVNKHFFRFPRNSLYHQLWKDICNITVANAKNFFVCEDHFKDSDFVNERKERLNINAVPLLINPPEEDPLLLLDSEITVNGCLTDPSSSSLQRNCFHSQNEKVTYFSQDHDYCLRLNNLC
ncbi:hypothetical protein ILUMI_27232, partial [Ignelater luminosus]